jgi:cytochrome c
MSRMRRIFRMGLPALVVAAIAAMRGGVCAADPVTKDEAVAMVKKAVAYIKTEGADKAYAEIASRQFVDCELYIVVYRLDGTVLAHVASKSRIGTNQIDDKDPDGKVFVRPTPDGGYVVTAKVPFPAAAM